jgi:hypothetical protein
LILAFAVKASEHANSAVQEEDLLDLFRPNSHSHNHPGRVCCHQFAHLS